MAQDLNDAVDARIQSDITASKPVEAATGNLKLPTNYAPDVNLQDAITKRMYDKYYNEDEILNKQKINTTRNAMQQSNNLQGAVQGVANLNKQKMDLARQRVADGNKQRAAVIGSILGVGGTIAGAYLGGPAGAAIGAQVGSTAGQSMAGGDENDYGGQV